MSQEGAGVFGNVEVRPSGLAHPQFEDRLGVFALGRFRRGQVVIRWALREVSRDEYVGLPDHERRQFTHVREGRYYLYPDPERHVNRSGDPNLRPDFEEGGDVATRDLEPGEELTIPEGGAEDW